MISRRVAGRDLSSRSCREFCGFAVKGLTLRITIRLGLREVISQMGNSLTNQRGSLTIPTRISLKLGTQGYLSIKKAG